MKQQSTWQIYANDEEFQSKMEITLYDIKTDQIKI